MTVHCTLYSTSYTLFKIDLYHDLYSTLYCFYFTLLNHWTVSWYRQGRKIYLIKPGHVRSPQCNINGTQCTLNGTQCTLNGTLCTLHIILNTVHYTIQAAHSIHNIAHWHNVHYTLYSAHCTACPAHLAVHIVHSTLPITLVCWINQSLFEKSTLNSEQ